VKSYKFSAVRSGLVGVGYNTSNSDFDNYCVTSTVAAANDWVELEVLPNTFQIRNFPNPFNPTTTIEMNLPTASSWNIVIFNITGQKVAEYNGYNEAGPVSVTWDGRDHASGVYFYKAKAGEYTATQKMVLIK
jgi:hypothetical protein